MTVVLLKIKSSEYYYSSITVKAEFHHSSWLRLFILITMDLQAFRNISPFNFLLLLIDCSSCKNYPKLQVAP